MIIYWAEVPSKQLLPPLPPQRLAPEPPGTVIMGMLLIRGAMLPPQKLAVAGDAAADIAAGELPADASSDNGVVSSEALTRLLLPLCGGTCSSPNP